MKVSYEPKGINNFHNSQPINLIVSGKEHEGMYIVSGSQHKRIVEHFCGVSGCGCAGGACQQLEMDGSEWGVCKEWCSLV